MLFHPGSHNGNTILSFDKFFPTKKKQIFCSTQRICFFFIYGLKNSFTNLGILQDRSVDIFTNINTLPVLLIIVYRTQKKKWFSLRKAFYFHSSRQYIITQDGVNFHFIPGNPSSGFLIKKIENTVFVILQLLQCLLGKISVDT